MFNYTLYRFGQFVALLLPRRMVYAIAVFCSDLHYIFAFKDHRSVRDNLRVVFPEKSSWEIRLIRLKMFRNFAKHMVDFMRFAKIDKEFVEKNVKIENLRYVDEALAKGKGVITLTAHMGSWELGGAVIGVLGYPFCVVALPHKSKKVTDFFDKQRESKGVKVIPLGHAAYRCLRALKENEILGLVGDRDFQETGKVMSFFGKPMIFPEGPAAFAVKLGSAIVPGFLLRNQDDTVTFRFEKAIEFVPTGNKEKDEETLIAKYKIIFEDYIRKYPGQWYMFRRFWVQ